jgi:hypothetical protein
MKHRIEFVIRRVDGEIVKSKAMMWSTIPRPCDYINAYVEIFGGQYEMNGEVERTTLRCALVHRSGVFTCEIRMGPTTTFRPEFSKDETVE